MKPLNITLSLEEYHHLVMSLEQSRKKCKQTQEQYESQREEMNRLRWEVEYLKRRLWGKSSEKRILPEDPSQLSLCFDSPSDVSDPLSEEKRVKDEVKKKEESYTRFRKHFTGGTVAHARKPIPEGLRREEVVVPMPEGIDLEGAVRMGEEVSEQYAYRPSEIYVIRTVRPKYRLKDGSLVTAGMPVMAHPHSNASESILAHIATAKYADHQPLHRQIGIFSREGVELSASTLSNWMMAAAERLEPIYNELREEVKKSYYVMADETPHPVLENDHPGALHRGYMWGFYLPHRKAPYFEYHKGRGHTGVDTLLEGEVKAVQSDGFTVYDLFDTLPGKVHLCCWAHVRRKFTEALGCDPPRAEEALKKIGLLYKVEEEIKEKGWEAEAVVKLRREKAYPVIRELEAWCRQEFTYTVKDSPIAKAMSYLYTRFEQLSGYVNDARFRIDNNPVERSIRPLTLNRKNALFSGSHEAAHAAAIFFSLLGCCRENEVNPEEWMKDVLIRVQDKQYCIQNDYSPLLPYNWTTK